jgi:hypothetical protein
MINRRARALNHSGRPDRRRIDRAEQVLEFRPVDRRSDCLLLPVAPGPIIDQPLTGIA